MACMSATNYALADVGQIEAQSLRKLRQPSRSSKLRAFMDEVSDTMDAVPPQAPSADDLLVSLSGMLEPDGGMPGKEPQLRIANSLVALLSFYEHGNTATSGTFRMHVQKLLQFLTSERLKKLEARCERAAQRVLEPIRMGRLIHGSWEQFVTTIVQSKQLDVADFWTKIESALKLATPSGRSSATQDEAPYAT
jgi:hypothetical protein